MPNKMQSEIADVTPGAVLSGGRLDQTTLSDVRLLPPPGELHETYASSLFLAPLCENTMSSAKPEVHIVLHCRQRRNETRLQVTSTENLMKFDEI